MTAKAVSATHDAKRVLIDSLEMVRHGAVAPVTQKEPVPAGRSSNELLAEIERLRDKNDKAQATCDMLAESLAQMENRALEAISEVGMLKAQRVRSVTEIDNAEYQNLRALLRGKQEENRLLTEALAASENEISRLTKALALAMEKLL